MVAIPVEPCPAAMGTQRIAFILAIMLEKVIAAEYFMPDIAQPATRLQQRARHQNLVEQVPLSPVKQRAFTFIFQRFPPRIVKLAFFHLLAEFACPQFLQTFIHRVIIHVTHYNDFQFAALAQQGVFQCLYLACRMYPD